MKFVSLIGLICIWVCGALALENGLARTPPMGWVNLCCTHPHPIPFTFNFLTPSSLHGKDSVVIQTVPMILKTALGNITICYI